MNCNIVYVGKSRNGTPKYFCTTHKSFVSSKGERLEECLCTCKDLYFHCYDLKKMPVNSIQIVYEDILSSCIPKIFIQDKEYSGVFQYDDSILNYKDFGGIMLSKLNSVTIQEVICNHCHHKHSDNGKFSYVPHKTHLCLYCGHMFRVREANIGSELESIYHFPSIVLQNKSLEINQSCSISYELFSGRILVNGENVSDIIFQGKKIGIVDFLNKILKDEF